MMLKPKTPKLTSTVGSVVLGILISLALGVVPNESGVGIPEVKHYGHPLVWHTTNLNGPSNYILTNLAIDTAFWITISVIASVVLTTAARKWEITVTYRTLILPLVLLIPSGLVMCLIHELGHGLWGTLAGGRLLYIHIAYVIIYPVGIRFSSHFRLGAAAVDGLNYGSFEYGFMLLGGSLLTSIAAWIIAVVLYKARLGSRAQVALKVLGLWGILDLPFYVIFPQMGLRHWIVIGGRGPEPLAGARMMGISDSAFYIAVVLSTIGLIVLCFKPLCGKVVKQMKVMLEVVGRRR